VIGTDNQPGGGGVYMWNGSAFTNPVGGSGLRISVNGIGLPRLVNKYQAIYAYNNPWQQLPGSAYDIGSGADFSLWVIGTNSVPGGNGIFYFNGSSWTSFSGGGVRIAIAPDGNPWVVNSTQDIYCYNGTNWVHVPGKAYDVGVGANGSAWVIGTNSVPGGFGIYHWTPDAGQPLCGAGSFSSVAGGGTQISVGTDGLPFVVNSAGAIYERIF
jgi:hypothetical protein